MILLVTNVVSEPMRPVPDARIGEWINSQPLDTLWLSAMTVAELRAGVALLPAGKRRTVLHESLEQRILPLFEGRVLAFDMACTNVYAQLTAKARAVGKVVETADACIAATALVYGYAVATRDAVPFQAAGVKVINPWKMKPA
ncbi:MAG: type II toxin-antitoxin system VapC family toxin [Burkholderiaceae bacterium]|jgi:predicted nucleic acid-binding protein|nr:type II toxin-antitoxin system VapC family toxin [Burkholderiaceae bacterium]